MAQATTVATLVIDYDDIVSKAFSRQRLVETRTSEKGAVNLFLSYFKSENFMGFDTSRVTLGKPEDNFIIMYYCEGMRYKIMKDGTALVSSAEPEQMFDLAEEDLKEIVSMLLVDEIMRLMPEPLHKAGVNLGKRKNIETGTPGIYKKAFVGASSK